MIHFPCTSNRKLNPLIKYHRHRHRIDTDSVLLCDDGDVKKVSEKGIKRHKLRHLHITGLLHKDNDWACTEERQTGAHRQEDAEKAPAKWGL